MAYQPGRIEPKWQKYWDEQQTFAASDTSTLPKFYALDMFPYPSGKGLHVGHPAGYTASDVVSRYKRARGFNVLHPMGWDAFGLPAEQKAIEEGVPPQQSTKEAIDNFRGQLKQLGLSYDWAREISTASPDYYKWTQWIFTRLYEAGLAYQSDMTVNWCEALGTVLANDEVIDGKSERGGHPVERRLMRQWMLRITKYADKLLAGLDELDWPEATKKRQREWIGRSEGAHVDFNVSGGEPSANGSSASPGLTIRVFTTRPDTLWGATYMVLAPEHALVAQITTPAQQQAVAEYRKQVSARSDVDRQEAKEKTGVFTGAHAINPATGQPIPVWIADYVLMGYGTGAIMAVPAHDERDYAFAKAMDLPMAQVVSGGDIANEAHTGEGELVASGPLTGAKTEGRAAVRAAITWVEKKGVGVGAVTYRLRDWVFARQRYWGEPIPVLKRGKEVARVLTENELPLELPLVANYAPTGAGSPLTTVAEWVNVQEGGETLQRETDTMPGSAGSSWYFLRYIDPHNAAAFAARDKTDYWMPVDLYVGGPEHTVGHLLYSRMWQRFLYEQGLTKSPEPFHKLRHQGMIQGITYYDGKHIVPHDQIEQRGDQVFRKGGDIALTSRVEKMSKRKGNVINPTDVIAEHGADALRIYICFMGPLEADKPWQTAGLEGQAAWLKRVWRLYFEGDDDTRKVTETAASAAALKLIHKAIKKVTEDIENLSLNTAISALHITTRELLALGETSRAVLEPLAQLFGPFAPHYAEELWEKGLSKKDGISRAPWPKWDPALVIDETIKMGVQIMGKTQGEIEIAPDADEATAVAAAQANVQVARFLEGKTIKKVIYKAGRILNLVVG